MRKVFPNAEWREENCNTIVKGKFSGNVGNGAIRRGTR